MQVTYLQLLFHQLHQDCALQSEIVLAELSVIVLAEEC